MPLDGNLALLHRFQQGRLGTRSGAVNLVGKQDIGDHRTFAVAELRRTRIEHHGAGDISWEQIRSELHAAETSANCSRQRSGEHGLAESRHIFQQHMAFTKDRDDRSGDHLSLANNDLFHLRNDLVDRIGNHLRIRL